MPGDAPPELTPAPVRAPGPHPVRIVLRGALAGLATESLLALALLILGRALHAGGSSAQGLLLFAAGAGLVAGLAWGVAEAVSSRVRRSWLALLAGVAAGAPLVAAAPIAGEYLLRLRAAGSSLAALDGTLAEVLDRAFVAALLPVVACAACVHAPLLAVRRRGHDLALEAVAASLGAVAWGVTAALLHDGAAPWSLNASLYAVALLARAPVFPLALRVADRGCALASERARGVEREAAPASSPRRRAPTPADRHLARWHEDRAREHADAGRAHEAAAAWARAHALAPTVERALALARAHARAEAVLPAVAALEEAAALAGGRPAGFDPAEPAWEPLRGHASFEALAAAPGRSARPRRGPARRLALSAYATTLALLALAPAARWPDEPAEVTRLRVRAWLGGGAAAWREVGDALAAGPQAPDGPATWTTGQLLALGAVLPEVGHERVLKAYLRAAEAGDAEAMLRASDALACYPARRREAAAWCRRAAEARHPRAMWRWGAMLSGAWLGLARDEAGARAWWLRAAEAGVVEAQVQLARSHAREGDLAAADRWFARAAAQGHATAEEERASLAAARAR